MDPSQMTEEQLKPFELEYSRKRSARLSHEHNERERKLREDNDKIRNAAIEKALKELRGENIHLHRDQFDIIWQAVLDQPDYYDAPWR